MKASWKRTADSTMVSLVGGIREEAAQPLEELAAALPPGPILVDMDKVDHINSVGCGHWVRFIRSRGTQGEVGLLNCHEGVVTYANLLPAFSVGVAIKSVHYPLRCPGCRKATTKIIDVASLGNDPNAALAAIASEICGKCGETLEPGADPDDFLSFLCTQDE